METYTADPSPHPCATYLSARALLGVEGVLSGGGVDFDDVADDVEVLGI